MINALGEPQSVFVLGATSAIAEATATAWGARGDVRFELAARPGARRTAVAARLRALGNNVTEWDFEAVDTDAHQDLVERVAAKGDVDVTLVAFGVLGDPEKAWQDHDTAMRVVAVNFAAAVSVGVLMADVLRSQGHGSIVALSSVAGERVRRSNFVYGATKAGMDGFYLNLGEALRADGGHVLVVRPGFVRSPMTEGMDEAPLAVDPAGVAAAIVSGVADRRDLIWVPAPLRVVMSGLRHVPRRLFRRLPI